jgi:hypothetical protein
MNIRKTPKKMKKSIKTYIFTIKKIVGKKIQKTIHVSGALSLAEFDLEIRNAMNFDTFDHISAFYDGKPHRSLEIATITPDGDGDNSKLILDQIGLEVGVEMGYVYDFGDDIQCLIKLDEILLA